MKNTRFFLERLIGLVLALLGVSAITFAISYLIPTDVARMIAGDFASEETVAAIREELGLNRPMWAQYLIYMRNLLSGDFGVSIQTGQAILGDLLFYLPATAELALSALFLAVIVGVPLGVVSAIYEGRWPDHVIRFFSLVGISTPSFWLGLMLVLLFYGVLGWLPAGGRLPPEHFALTAVTGFYTIDALLAGDIDLFVDVLRHLALPSLSLTFLLMGGFVRLIRAGMLETLREDYIRTVRAAGVGHWRVVIRHALPNALIPFVTALGLSLANLLTGAVVTEVIFMWPGMGSYILEAASALDFPVIMGFTVIAAVIYVLANFVVDLAYIRLDPAQGHRSS